jgi:hypothetical protein
MTRPALRSPICSPDGASDDQRWGRFDCVSRRVSAGFQIHVLFRGLSVSRCCVLCVRVKLCMLPLHSDLRLSHVRLMRLCFAALSPTVVANLWDVTDGEIDRYCAALLRHWIGDAPTNSAADGSASNSAGTSTSASGAVAATGAKKGAAARGGSVGSAAASSPSASAAPASSSASAPTASSSFASLSTAVQLGRRACNLHYLTGALTLFLFVAACWLNLCGGNTARSRRVS